MAEGQGRRPVALMFHQGAFVGGGDDMMRQQMRAARRAGFKPVRVDYTLGNLPQAIKDAKAAAARYGPRRKVVAYGDSAGGGLASLLAARGRVDAAASYSGVNNMAKWFQGRDTLGATPEQLRRWSATAKRAKSPILALTTKVDPFVNPAATRQWAVRDPRVRHRAAPGLHIGPMAGAEREYAQTLRGVMDFLARRAGRR